MQRFAIVFLAAGLSIAPVGCSRRHSEPAEAAPPAAHISTAESNDRAIEQDEKAIEQQAQQGKRAIDSIAASAEDALKRAQANVKAEATDKARKTAEAAAEAAEDAKDRAEDADLFGDAPRTGRRPHHHPEGDEDATAR